MVGQGNVVVGFMPDRFDNERVAEHEVFAGHDGRSAVSACATYPDSLARLAAVP